MPKKRNDVSERLKNRKKIQERVVCCSLNKRLGNEFNDEICLLLKDEINDWVITVSKITHRLGIIFNRLLIYLMSNNTPLPSFTDAFFNGLALHGMKKSSKQSKLNFSSLINDFCSNEFNSEYNQYPIIKRNNGDCQAIKIASSKYKNNFLTSLNTAFFSRQEVFISQWLYVNKICLDKQQKRYILYEINNWKYSKNKNKEKINFDVKIKNFIIEQRNKLDNPKYLDEEWLKKNPNIVLLYYYYMNRYYNKYKLGNKFKLAPLPKIKSHFLSVDNTVLREILNNVIKKADKENISYPSWIKEKIKNKDMCLNVWKSVFNYNGLRRQMTFSNRVETDGVKINFHFQITNKKKNKKTKRMNKKIKSNRVISIDPGRSNLITAYDKEKDKYFILTRKYYYRACGMKAVVRKNNLLNLKIKGILENMSKTTTKSVNDNDWFNYQQIILRNYDKLWSLYTTEERKKDSFNTKRLKEKCLDRFFNQFQEKGEEKPIIAYGGASINPTGKGELSVPIKYVYDKCKQKYKTIKVDEKNTTLMHYKCQKQTIGVENDKGNIRGLRWCSICRELVSRDQNACKNITLIYQSAERPNYLSKTFKGEKKKFFLRGKLDTPIITKMSNDILKPNG